VLNKYYPPDFDPAKLPKGKKPKNNQQKVRMMLPMSVRCNTCGEYLYKGKKFNSRKETVNGEDYLGIRIFRFYLKCTRCSSEFTIKTDPRNADYVCEVGVSRNFEPWREKEKEIIAAKDKRSIEEQGDVLKALENRTTDNKIEMDILDALDEIRSLNARNSKVDHKELMSRYLKSKEEEERQLDEEDEALIQSIQFGIEEEDEETKEEIVEISLETTAPIVSTTEEEEEVVPKKRKLISASLTPVGQKKEKKKKKKKSGLVCY